MRTLKADFRSEDPPSVQVTYASSDISSDTAADESGIRHMQLARATGDVVGLHQRLENWSAALLTTLAAHGERDEYAGSSVMIAVCCEVERLGKLRSASRRLVSSSVMVKMGLDVINVAYAKLDSVRGNYTFLCCPLKCLTEPFCGFGSVS